MRCIIIRFSSIAHTQGLLIGHLSIGAGDVNRYSFSPKEDIWAVGPCGFPGLAAKTIRIETRMRRCNVVQHSNVCNATQLTGESLMPLILS